MPPQPTEKDREKAEALAISVRRQLQEIDIEEVSQRAEARKRREGFRGQVGIGAEMDSRREKVWKDIITKSLAAERQAVGERLMESVPRNETRWICRCGSVHDAKDTLYCPICDNKATIDAQLATGYNKVYQALLAKCKELGIEIKE